MAFVQFIDKQVVIVQVPITYTQKRVLNPLKRLRRSAVTPHSFVLLHRYTFRTFPSSWFLPQMGSRPRNFTGIMPMRRTRRRPNPNRRVCKHLNNSRIRASWCSPAVSEKLEALNNLVPPVHIDRGEIKADQLFQETAEYIVLLQNQISVLQKLVDFYGSSAGQAQENQIAVQYVPRSHISSTTGFKVNKKIALFFIPLFSRLFIQFLRQT